MKNPQIDEIYESPDKSGRIKIVAVREFGFSFSNVDENDNVLSKNVIQTESLPSAEFLKEFIKVEK